jgi:probable HAF family extracellular repeat protein
MRKAHPYVRGSFRATLTLFIALGLGAIALLSLGTKPAETKPTTPKPLYIVRDLGTLGGANGVAFGINNADQVVGGSGISGDTEEHAFLWADEGDPNTDDMKDLGTLGGCCSNAFDINEAGKVVGFSMTTSGSTEPHAFLYSSGQGMTDLGTLPGRTSSIAFGINNADQVVGSSSFAEDIDPHPFLYSGGVMRDLNTLIPPNSGWELREAWDINDNGHIVGRGSNEDGENRAFLLVRPGKGLGPGQPR